MDRAISAMVAAIEIYNKPGFPYRNESFTILAINGWELLLKAQWLSVNKNRKNSLYVYESRKNSDGSNSKKRYIRKTRSGTPFTHSIGYLAKKLSDIKILDHSARQNIEIMLEFRDCATHFYNETPYFNSRLYEIGAACIKNFANAANDWFGADVSEFDLHLMPLTFLHLPSKVSGTLLNIEEKNFLAFLGDIDDLKSDPEDPYSVTISIDFRFVKSKTHGALAAIYSKDPSALPIHLTEEDIHERYPWDFARLTDECRKRFKDFKANGNYHKIRKALHSDDRFAHSRFLDPGNPKSATKIFFNPNIVTEIGKYYEKNEG